MKLQEYIRYIQSHDAEALETNQGLQEWRIYNMQAKNIFLDRYKIVGHFYTQQIAGSLEHLRSSLEIKRISKTATSPNFIVIMMNPGSSEPLDENFIQQSWNFIDPKIMTEAKPDKTQYQLMRLMDEHCLDYLKVINLSDLRTPKSQIFFSKIMEYKKDKSHSIFHSKRTAELSEILEKKEIPIIAGWGLSPELLILVDLIEGRIKNRTVIGIKHPALDLYKHPLPPRYDWQQNWINDISNQIKKLNY